MAEDERTGTTAPAEDIIPPVSIVESQVDTSPSEGDDSPDNLRQRRKAASRHSPNRQRQTSATPPPSANVAKVKKYSHALYIHTTVRASPLSKESPEQNYRGLLNLALILLFVSNARLVVENYAKYGLLVRFPYLERRMLVSELPYIALALLVQATHVLLAYAFELIALQNSQYMPRGGKYKVINQSLAWVIAIVEQINVLGCVTIACVIVWHKIVHPLAAFSIVMAATVTSLKLFSYAAVNHDLRLHMTDKKYEDLDSREAEALDGLKEESALVEIPYPKNLLLSDVLFFWVLPTLVYQTSYPRTPFRLDFCIKRLGEVIFCLLAFYTIASQYAAPTLANSLHYLDQGQYFKLVERILKLSVVSVSMWLVMFYGFFHAFLNLLAEITGFGDRRFYLPWWNSADIAQYWRLWNAPVYNWSKRHIYLPLVVNYKVPTLAATAMVFLVSAVLHEVIIGVPLHNINFWAFGGMLMQLPLVYVTRHMDHLRQRYFRSTSNLFDTMGNVIFWISFTIVGQPSITLAYYAQYHIVMRAPRSIHPKTFR
ncbi:diacylglycerol O-acyltransferase [Synchytrium endobioticum]|nr:diacylglycerol O-acyltransferase [Synchytrium endobioticum]